MNFIAIDFETAKYSRESACSVGLVKFKNGKIIDRFYSLIRPPVLYIRPDFTEIHGLTVDNVRDASGFDDVWKNGILPFIGDIPLAAHNASFDISVLQSALAWYELPVPQLSYFCTLALARKTWPELSSHALISLGEAVGIIYEAHNALADAETCGNIACMAAEKYGSGNIEELLAVTEIDMGTLKKVEARPLC
jgi:DNA polymerase-3 subunit epsilon